MKHLYIVRHAKSSWVDCEVADVERPLNKRGKKDAPVMGERLKDRGVTPDLIVSSPAKRAYKTAKKIAKKLDYPKKRIVKDESIYEGSEGDLLQVIRRADSNVESLMIFGHNPGFTFLANALVGEPLIDNIPTCGVFRVDFDVDDWREVEPGTGKFQFFDYPKDSQT